jgi:hypothetical protein
MLGPDRDLIRRLLRVGVPGGMDTLLIIFCHLWFVSVINRLGDLAAAAHGVAIRIESLAFLSGIAFQVAATTMAGQYLGARDHHRAGWSVLLACLVGGGVMATAGAKGPGKWMSQLALDLGVPSTLVTEAVYARCLSAMRDARLRAAKLLDGPSGTYEGDRQEFTEQIRQALYASKICSYAQGFVQLQEAAKEHDWPLKFGPTALLWRGGCIIRAVFLERIKEAFDADANLENLLLAPYFKEAVESAQPAWRHVVTSAIKLGIPTPAFSAALAYYDGYRSPRLPANLLQSQRDYFGAHT